MDQQTRRIVSFIQSIGIGISFRRIGTPSFLPGISIEEGGIVIDEERLPHPGDLLHEAGHIAVVPAAERHTLDAASIAARKDSGAEELAAIAWSYAAACHLELAPDVVFHGHGYNGGGDSIINAFTNHSGIGVPMLQYYGLSYEPKTAEASGARPFPEMIGWLRD